LISRGHHFEDPRALRIDRDISPTWRSTISR
jgi:hypothetical protein